MTKQKELENIISSFQKWCLRKNMIASRNKKMPIIFVSDIALRYINRKENQMELKEKIKEMIKVMEHYADGGEVEYSVKEDVYSSWIKCVNPLWDWNDFEYRVKEPKQKVTIEKWLIKDVDSGEHLIMASSDIDLTLRHSPEWIKVKLLGTYEVEL